MNNTIDFNLYNKLYVVCRVSKNDNPCYIIYANSTNGSTNTGWGGSASGTVSVDISKVKGTGNINLAAFSSATWSESISWYITKIYLTI